jgi:hypothetical protein
MPLKLKNKMKQNSLRLSSYRAVNTKHQIIMLCREMIDVFPETQKKINAFCGQRVEVFMLNLEIHKKHWI